MSILRMSIVILVGLVLGMLLLQGAEADSVRDGTAIILPGDVWDVSFEVYRDATISIEMSSRTSIDIIFIDYSYVADGTYFLATTEYSSGEFEDYYKDKSELNTTRADYSFDVSEGAYSVLFDNTDVPAGGASGAGTATVDYSVGIGYDEEEDAEIVDAMCIVLILITTVIAIIIVAIIILRLRGRKKNVVQVDELEY